MKHPAEMARFLEHAKLLRGAADVARIHLFPREGLKKALNKGRGGRYGNFCGRGDRGQHRDRRYTIKHFHCGGNTPFYRLFRKHGHANPAILQPLPTEVTLDHIQKWIERGFLNPDKPIDMSLLKRANLVESCSDGIKLVVGDTSRFNSKIDVVVTSASFEAIRLIEQCGGRIVCRYFNTAERKHLNSPSLFVNRNYVPPQTLPYTRRDIDFYMDPLNRGYLAVEEDRQKPIQHQYQESYEMNSDKVSLPENLSQHKNLDPERLRFEDDPRSRVWDYGTVWENRKRKAFLDYRGSDRFANRLLKASDDVKEVKESKETSV